MNSSTDRVRFQDLYIAQPCSEKWQDMDANTGGAYCRHCKKVVIDFTQKSEDELNAILHSGEWTGCGRFRVNQIGQPPMRKAIAFQRSIVERWRSGAASALLFWSLWQMPATAKAVQKPMTNSLDIAPQPRLGQQLDSPPNSLVAGVLIDENGEHLKHDLLVILRLANGDSIPLQTKNGFFSIDLAGKAREEDTLEIYIPAQQFEDQWGKATCDVYTHPFLLAYAYDLRWTIPYRVEWDDRYIVGAMPPRIPKTPLTITYVDDNPPPLIRSKTPEEKAALKAERAARKAAQEADKVD